MNQPIPTLSMLAVDDEVSIQLILQHYFKESFIVVTKGNGQEALNWMQEGNIPDVIIADIQMPQLDGYAFIDQVRSSGFLRNVPLIMLSASDSSDNRIRCLEAGADDYMVKPFNPRELAARVNGILRRLGKL
ncbi:MAG: response regulator transcription factor [Ferruginibacter sp.]